MAATVKRKRGFDDAPLGQSKRKVSTDVYPDPEPDDPVDLLASTHMDSIASKLRAVQETRPKKAFLNKEGVLVDEFGQPLEQDAADVRVFGANKRSMKPKKETKEEKRVEEEKPAFYDNSLEHFAKRGRRQRLVFNEDLGKHARQAEKLRTLAEARQGFKDKKKQAEEALKRGERLNVDPDLLGQPKEDKKADDDLLEVPDCETWDASILVTKSYDDVRDQESKDPLNWRLKFKLLSSFIEHPVPVSGPNTAAVLPPQPLMLTKKERKKRRTAMRIAREKDKQQEIALGLREPPPPKVKISNMMTVKGIDAVQNPTVIEQFVRKEMAERVGRHEMRNQERKLDPEERRKKTISKMTKQAEDDPLVSIYRIGKLHSTKAIWKITQNAEQFHLTGMLVRVEGGLNMVVTQGGKKPTDKYTHLLTHRIDYDLDEGDEDDSNPNARLVWQGFSGKRTLQEFKSLTFSDAEKAKRYLSGIEWGHYWDLIASGRDQADLSDDELL